MGSLASMFTAGAEHTIEQAKVDANRATQKMQNEYNAEMSSLQRESQAIQNKYVIEAAATQFNDAGGQIAGLIDSAARGTLTERLQAASAMGAASAAAAAAGVGGGSVDAFARSQRFMAAYNDQQQDDALTKTVNQAIGNRYEIMQQGILNQRNDTFFADLDFTQYLDHQKQEVAWGSVLATVAATAFGGPMAGMMVGETLGQVSRAGYLMKNNQPGLANQQLSSAFSSGYRAVQGISAGMDARGGQSWLGSVMGSGAQSNQNVQLYGLKLK